MIKEYLISLVQHYGSAAIFIGLALEYVGLPIPGETMMTFLGFLVRNSAAFYIGLALVSAIAGSFAGSGFAWFIGFRYGENILLKYGKYIHITKEKIDSTNRLFEKHRVLLLLFGRYIPGVRHLVPYMSGIDRMKLHTYFIYNLIGSVIWCTSFIGLGYFLGEKWTVVEKLIKSYSLIIILLVVFVVIVFKFFSRHKKAIFAFAFPVLLFIKISEDMIRQELSVFDNTIYHYVSRLISHNMTGFMRFLSFSGSMQALIFVAVIAMLILWRSRKYHFYGTMAGVNLLASSLLVETFVIAFHRERPDILRLVEISGFSFPSGHAMISLSFYGFIAYLFHVFLKSRWKYPIIAFLAVLILSIGISKIYLGIHYASDVLAGFSAGLGWLAVFITLVNRINLIKKQG